MPEPATTLAPRPITSDAHFAKACRRWAAAGVIGLDTEFIRERTYYPRPALLQVSDAEGALLVDTTAISDHGPLAEVLADPDVVVVMHACGEDLEVLEVMTGTGPRRVFDTQLAAAFAGLGFALGYRALVATLLDINLDKGETRSDWLRRPLSPSQLHYATLDVLYLLPLYRHLSSTLERLKRSAWVEEEFAHQRRAGADGSRPEAACLRIRGRGALSPVGHAVLRRLCAWREREAMTRDKPRRHLLSDEALLALADAATRTGGRLNPGRTMPDPIRRRYGSVVVECIRDALADGPTDADHLVDLRPHTETLARMRDTTRQAAQRCALAPELLAPRRALQSLLTTTLKGEAVPAEFQGWRSTVVTPALLDCLRP
ncbi:MAG: ribonuclease D [Thiotrichales bacterium]|nr:ribonuclease D [Thiotrichales bacterium]